MTTHPGTALVTGASSGIGREFARQLASAGHDLVVVARRGRILEELADSLTRDFGVAVKVIALDLERPGAVHSLAGQVEGIDISLVVLSAGTAEVGDFLEVDLDLLRSVTRLNVDVPVEMAHVFGKRLVARGGGGLILVSSLFGFQPVPLMANYAASKAYLLALGRALHHELRTDGVDVLVVAPGLTDTDMPASLPADFDAMPIAKGRPERVVQVALRSLGRRAVVVPGATNKAFAWQNRVVPASLPPRVFGALLRRSLSTGQTATASAQSPAPR